MSVQAISWVLDDSKARGLARLVLISIANHASKFGCRSFPSTRLISEEAGVSEREVRYSVKELIDLGELTVRYKASDLGTNDYCLVKMHPANCAECMEKATRQRPGKKHHGTRQMLAPEPSLTVVEPPEPARSEVAKKIAGQPQHFPQKRANPFPIETSNKNALRANVSRLAKSKRVSHLNPHRSSETVHLEAGIFRHHVSAAYFDSVHNGLSHKEGFGEALDQAIRSLLSNRGAVELRGVRKESLHAATWTRLAAFVEPLAQISDYSRRENQVVSTIVRVVCEEALRLTTQPTAAAVNG